MKWIISRIFILTFLVLHTSCASKSPTPEVFTTNNLPKAPSSAPAPPSKTYISSKEFIDEAKHVYEQGKFTESLGLLNEAIKLDPNNFQAYALRGESWVRLGEGMNASQDFQRTIEINFESPEARHAQMWLTRMKDQLPIIVVPLNLNTTVNLKNNWEFASTRGGKTETWTREETILKKYGDYSQNKYELILKNIIARSGFYQQITLDRSYTRLIERLSGIPFHKETIFGQPNKRHIVSPRDYDLLTKQLCFASNKKGAKIAIHSKRADLNLKERANMASFLHGTPIGLLQIIPGVSSVFDDNTSYDIELIFDINVFETKQCSVVSIFNKYMIVENVPGNQVEPVLFHVFDVLFYQIALDIHAALL